MDQEVKRKPAGVRERAGAVLLLAFGLYALFEAAKLPFGGVRAPDAGFFPVCVAAALSVFALMAMLAEAPRDEAGAAARDGNGATRVAIAAVALLLYALFLKPVGFLVCTLLLMLLLLRGICKVSWRASLLAALPAVALSYFLFTRLGVPLPAGVLAF
ncbi:MAG: tripartite tricarboxylate transporter TctB family protein [Betaproteobacteria bacterium]|nr:tripartite tricarboxylate transporter TctB family protein [Betaproteobacteria bacterium]MBI2225675.1 tripartite tricarboxylate transporter TctB family protein [Betaproteobacteria bacterium]MBI3054973.1 tripartite tricarboxylate transporter TctB family protein [Betaproteobacteria bacterium]